MKKYVLALAGSLALIVFSCSKKSEDQLTALQGGGACDTTNSKYAADVVPIVSANCYSCHGTSTNANSGGILLEGYDNLKIMAEKGILIAVITHADGFPPMPQNVPKLSDCNINTIRSWINNGAQNN